jgi:hypothetical protein
VLSSRWREEGGQVRVPRLTDHAVRRVVERGIDPSLFVPVLERKLKDLRADIDVAVKLGTLKERRGDPMTSHGEVVWAIIRDGLLKTVMFRRATQPATPEALRVDVVV